MLVVSDTSPITSLLAIGRFDIIETLYRTVIVPSAVAGELRACHEELPGCIQSRIPSDTAAVALLRSELDQGEAEAIVLARELHAELLLMDETLGRARARQEHVPVMGLVGVLLVARRVGLIHSMRATLDQLESKAGFCLSRDVVRLAVAQAGE